MAVDFAEAFRKIKDNTQKFQDKINSDEFQDKFRSPFDENGHYVGSKSKQKKAKSKDESSSSSDKASESRQVTGPHRDMSEHDSKEPFPQPEPVVSPIEDQGEPYTEDDFPSEEPIPQPKPDPRPDPNPVPPPPPPPPPVPPDPEPEPGPEKTKPPLVHGGDNWKGSQLENNDAIEEQIYGFPKGRDKNGDPYALALHGDDPNYVVNSKKSAQATPPEGATGKQLKIMSRHPSVKDIANAQPGDWYAGPNGKTTIVTQEMIMRCREKMGLPATARPAASYPGYNPAQGR